MLTVATKEIIAVSSRHSDKDVGSPASCAESQISEIAFRFCREFLPGSWRTIQLSDLIFHKISGGLSNLLYCCELPEHIPVTEAEPRRVLVRFYGQVNRNRALETLITECVILTLLSERQRGPRLYGVFPGGRLEEYVAARPLMTKELAHPNVSSKIAQKLATIHLMDVPMNRNPTRMWDSIERWIQRIEHLVEQQVTDNPELTTMIEKLRELDVRKELVWLRKFLEKVKSPVVFCHNDMQEGNILLRNGDSEGGQLIEPALENITVDDLVVIDFEYCGYNRRGFDLANHFVEWMYDYKNDSHPYFWSRPEKDHASVKQKEWFVEAYLSTLADSPSYRKRPEDTLEHILIEIEFYTLASHFFWSLWSVVSNSNTLNRAVEFDYWCYGESRFKEYYSHKAKLLKHSIR
ncbi:choline/ethanolamine kinase-like [Homalodisca vitripennis]|uniref:choline/ethanolamine kinase-like n=1 Tax=Homalodisca vitripennis TaxID=197043 RepID=UPI001EEC5CCD|nr:choline/ethanolamine kinase-like [Homalodisca vitripennis]